MWQTQCTLGLSRCVLPHCVTNIGDGSGDDSNGDGDDFVGVELLLRKIGGCPLGRPILQYPPTLHYTQSYV